MAEIEADRGIGMTALAVETAEAEYPSALYASYVVGVLVVAYTFSFIDRQILSLLVGPIKRDLAINDTEMSLLQGIAFALFYSFLGLPIGRLVDRSRRVTIVAAGVFVWSLMTACCGVARSFVQLFLARIGVGVGEASLSPAAYSMISDFFPPRRMGLALGAYGVGVYVGAGLALVIGAEVIKLLSGTGAMVLPLVGEIRPWQAVFFAVGLPGILVALWVATLREPARRGHRGVGGAAPPMSEVWAYLKANRRTLTLQYLCSALAAMMAYGVGAWVPSFLIRTHGWTAVEAGRTYGWIIAILGTAGVLSGGLLADWLAARFRSGRMMVLILSALLTLPFALAFPLVEDQRLCIILLAISTYFATLPTGAGASSLQEIMPNQMRGFASALLIFVVNLIGLGLGPTSIAAFTDSVLHDEAQIRYSLAYVPPTILAACALVGLASLKPYAASRDYFERWTAARSRL
ncbi:MAG TPA: MFS transporter [Aliidongia sp.]|nr:MFS transporter [Aliidongia sp.]